MSSKKIVAATTMTVAALGLGLAGYIQVTRASSTEDRDFHIGEASFPGHRAYLANHQAAHDGGGVFKRAEFEEHNSAGQPDIGQRFDEGTHDAEPARLGSTAHNADSGDLPLPSGGSGQYASNNVGRSGGGEGGWGSNFSGWSGGSFSGGWGGGGGGKKDAGHSSGNNPSQGGTNAPSGDAPADHQDHNPPTGPTDTNQNKPPHSDEGNTAPPGSGSNEPEAGAPKADDPKAGDPPPSNHNDDNDPPTGNTETPPDQNGPGDNYPPPQNDPPPTEVHSVPEPGTFGMLAFGLAAAALRRRRQS